MLTKQDVSRMQQFRLDLKSSKSSSLSPMCWFSYRLQFSRTTSWQQGTNGILRSKAMPHLKLTNLIKKLKMALAGVAQ